MHNLHVSLVHIWYCLLGSLPANGDIITSNAVATVARLHYVCISSGRAAKIVRSDWKHQTASINFKGEVGLARIVLGRRIAKLTRRPSDNRMQLAQNPTNAATPHATPYTTQPVPAWQISGTCLSRCANRSTGCISCNKTPLTSKILTPPVAKTGFQYGTTPSHTARFPDCYRCVTRQSVRLPASTLARTLSSGRNRMTCINGKPDSGRATSASYER